MRCEPGPVITVSPAIENEGPAEDVLGQQGDDRLVGRDDGRALEAGRQARVVALEEGPAAAGEEGRAGRRRAGVLAGKAALLVEVVELDVGVACADVLHADPGVLGAEGVGAGRGAAGSSRGARKSEQEDRETEERAVRAR